MTTPAAPPPVRPRRTLARTLLPLAVAAWLLLEIWLLITVADAAGGLTVLALLVAGVVLGAAAVKRAGRRAWRGLTTAARAGASGSETDKDHRDATEEPKHAVVAMLGGLLLMIPGLVSDVAGLLCLFPPTRAWLSRALKRAIERPRSYETGSLGDRLSQARMHRPGGKVIQGEVIEDRGQDGNGGTGTEVKKNPGPQR
jgi:UPF0716 protein FxsA